MQNKLFDFQIYAIFDSYFDADKANELRNFKGTVIVSKLEENGLKDPQKYFEFAEKIFNAVKLDINSEALFISSNTDEPIMFKQLTKIQGLRNVIVFGATPLEMGIHLRIPTNSIENIGKTKVFFTLSLDELIENKRQKELLWENLQKLFPK